MGLGVGEFARVRCFSGAILPGVGGVLVVLLGDCFALKSKVSP